MKVNVSKEQLLKAAGEPYLQATLPDFITLEGTPLQDNGTVEECCNKCEDYNHDAFATFCGDTSCPCHRKEEREHSKEFPCCFAPTMKDIEELTKLPSYYTDGQILSKINELVKGFNTLKNRI